MTRSEAMREYWKEIKSISRRTGASVREVRSDLKGKFIPTVTETHVYGDAYYYRAGPKRKEEQVTIRSNTPLSKDEVRHEASMIYNRQAAAYGETGGFWNEADFVVRGGSKIPSEFINDGEEDY